MTLKLQFDPNQKFQLDAVDSVVRLFEGLPNYTASFTLGDEIVPNLPPGEVLAESWLFNNLTQVQQANNLPVDPFASLTLDDGLQLEGVSYDSWRYPSFTIEMETGTGKTYVYLRTIYELRKHYGFSKFIIVVPSIAIYEGVIKNFQITLSHFRSLYSNENVNLTQYDGAKLSQLRGFATSSFVEVMVITLDSFNKTTNTIFRPSEKLPGERLPYQFIQQTRPILILDEPQNMESARAKEALRTLQPLFALRYSATHRSSPNQIYDLSPFDAYRQNLVKKIQVFGVTERENFNQPFLALQEVTTAGGAIKARLKTYVTERGRPHEADITLKHADDLYSRTNRAEHQGYKVAEINAAYNYVEFENGLRLFARETIGPSRPEIFRVQIRKTIEQHIKMQQDLLPRGIKVLSLFFIDRVANYTAPDGLIRRIFDEEFDRLKAQSPFFESLSASQVREAYFARSKPQRGEAEGQAIDTESRNNDERVAEKAAFELIMKKKEQLLSFEEPVCFIFAHSALKEGWDNPNVFQICTLNQTVSEIKKRQEIGRGLRLPVNQQGERVFEEEVNLLSVIANESYQSYAARLQSEYVDSGDAAPPAPRDALKQPARRNDQVYAAQAFQDFWSKLQLRTSYRIRIDTPALIQACQERINNQPVPQAVVVVEKGKFVVTEYTLQLLSVTANHCKLKLSRRDTEGEETVSTNTFNPGADLADVLRDERLRGFKIARIEGAGDSAKVTFSNNQVLDSFSPITFQSEEGQRISERSTLAPQASYPVFNLIDRAAKETGLTRPTINLIFKGLTDRKKQSIFANPEGFAALFITEINNALANHIVDRIEFIIDPSGSNPEYQLEALFPPEKTFPQKELIDAGPRGLYDQVQIDSDVEKRFVQYRLLEDDQVIFYFKFPPTFRILFPKVIGNYNPDWGIIRLFPDGTAKLELVRETKGGSNLQNLQFPAEARKILCARKHFRAIGIDYRNITDQTPAWWLSEDESPSQVGMEL